MLYVLCIGLFFPLAGFLGLVASSKWIDRKSTSIIACTTVFISFCCFLGLLANYEYTGMAPTTFNLYSWIPVDNINADFTLHLDPLALLMTLIITGVGFLIHVYSIGYMDHEVDYPRYFAFLNLFIFAMLLLVLAGNLLVLFVGWEGVGLASYLLIGFWYERPAAAAAATKAFVVNRIGDLGFLLGLLLTFLTFGTSDIAEISAQAGTTFTVGAPILAVLTLLYFIGATGKSAQIPLHVWLPDAMEGPTPVSALIHAATMVTAGVYLLSRLHIIYMLAPMTLQIVGIIGAVTSLFAALCALGQTDLKRVLAYSTVSQLGLMFLAVGAGAFYSAMFHLTTHAFVKALLFLSAGNVVHMLHGKTEMGQMGGLSKIFTKTHWLFLLGVLALSGIPPLATFFSKDLILEQEHLAGYDFLFYIGLAASILTGFYLTRAYCLTFTGTSHTDAKEFHNAHEAPNIMVVPVTILGLLAILGGFLGCTFCQYPILENFLSGLGITPAEKEVDAASMLAPEMLLAIGGSIVGVGSAALIYTRYAARLGHTIAFLTKAFYINEIYSALIVAPLKALSRFIDNIVEPKFFDGSMQITGQAAQGIAMQLQRIQSGEIRSYVAWMVVGAVALIIYLAL